MQLPSDLFNTIVQSLEHHQESLRIKKLVFCLCKKYWENDRDVLNTFPLKNLIKQLIQEHSTLESLIISLHNIVKILSRSQTYLIISQVIIEKLTPIYQELGQMGEGLINESTYSKPNFSQADVLIEKVVYNLSKHRETKRICKFIYAVCKKSFKDDLESIDIHELKTLIIDILNQYPTQEDLETAFNGVVATINKKDLYLEISKIILIHLDSLYDISSKRIALKPETNPSDSSIVSTLNPQETELQPSLPYDIFAMRLEIMQYTNPLRAKILLFSLLFHPWSDQEEDWSMLKSYTLDDLLEKLLQSGSAIAQIEAKLYTAAKSLAARSLNDSDIHRQVASTLIEVIKPYESPGTH